MSFDRARKAHKMNQGLFVFAKLEQIQQLIHFYEDLSLKKTIFIKVIDKSKSLTFSMYQKVLIAVINLLQLLHSRNMKYLVKNVVLKFLGQVINPEEIKQSMPRVILKFCPPCSWITKTSIRVVTVAEFHSEASEMQQIFPSK